MAAARVAAAAVAREAEATAAVMAAARAAVRAVRLAAGWEAAMAAASGFNTRKSRMKIPWRDNEIVVRKERACGHLVSPKSSGLSTTQPHAKAAATKQLK